MIICLGLFLTVTLLENMAQREGLSILVGTNSIGGWSIHQSVTVYFVIPVITFKVVSHMLIRPSPPMASLIGSMLLEVLELLQSMISVIHIGKLC